MTDIDVPWSERARGTFVEMVGVEIVSRSAGSAEGRLAIRPSHLAPNGYLHAGVVVTLADTCAGAGCMASLPEGAVAFTTIELKSNFIGTARSGSLTCSATLLHGGRTTQLWDAVVRSDESGKVVAAFRCTQLLLYPPPPPPAPTSPPS